MIVAIQKWRPTTSHSSTKVCSTLGDLLRAKICLKANDQQGWRRTTGIAWHGWHYATHPAAFFCTCGGSSPAGESESNVLRQKHKPETSSPYPILGIFDSCWSGPPTFRRQYATLNSGFAVMKYVWRSCICKRSGLGESDSCFYHWVAINTQIHTQLSQLVNFNGTCAVLNSRNLTFQATNSQAVSWVSSPIVKSCTGLPRRFGAHGWAGSSSLICRRYLAVRRHIS